MTNPSMPPMPQIPQPNGQRPAAPQFTAPQPVFQQPAAPRPAQPAAPQFAAPQYAQPAAPQFPAQAPAAVQPTFPQQPAAQQAAYHPRPVNQLRTKRSLLKYILLGIITFGIYDIWQMSEVGETLNLIASRRDGKRTMHYCLMFFLIGGLTLGIGWLVWYHRLSARIGDEQQARGMTPTVTAATFWLWDVLGIFIIVGPLVYFYKLLHAMNDLSADYNARG